MVDFDKAEIEMTIKALKAQVAEKDEEIAKLKYTLIEYGIEEPSEMSDEYFICTNELKKLKELSDLNGTLSDKEVKSFEILAKSLQQIKRGIDKKTPKGKEMNLDELLKVVDGGKDS